MAYVDEQGNFRPGNLPKKKKKSYGTGTSYGSYSDSWANYASGGDFNKNLGKYSSYWGDRLETARDERLRHSSSGVSSTLSDSLASMRTRQAQREAEREARRQAEKDAERRQRQTPTHESESFWGKIGDKVGDFAGDVWDNVSDFIGDDDHNTASYTGLLDAKTRNSAREYSQKYQQAHKQEEQNNYLEKFGDSFMNVLTSPYDLFSGMLQEKDPNERNFAENLGAAWRAGTYDVVDSLGGMAQYLGDKTGWDGLENAGDAVEKFADKGHKGYDTVSSELNDGFEAKDLLNPDFYSQKAFRQAPNVATSALGGVGAMKGFGALNRLKGLKKSIADRVVGGLVMGGTDAAMETGNTYNAAEDKGIDPVKAADKAFLGNMALNSGLDVAQFGLGFSPLGRITNKFGRAGAAAAKVTGGAGIEGLQEGTQNLIQSNALNEDFSWKSPETVESIVLGALMGGATTGAMEIGTDRGDTVTPDRAERIRADVENRIHTKMDDDLKTRYEKAKEAAKRNGYTEEDAEDYATRDLERNPKGKRIIDESVTESMDNLRTELKAEGKLQEDPRQQYAEQFNVHEDVLYDGARYKVKDIQGPAITLQNESGMSFTPDTFQVQKTYTDPVTEQRQQEQMKDYMNVPDADGIAKGMPVQVEGMDGVFTVTDNSDKSLVEIEAPNGKKLTAGRDRVKPQTFTTLSENVTEPIQQEIPQPVEPNLPQAPEAQQQASMQTENPTQNRHGVDMTTVQKNSIVEIEDDPGRYQVVDAGVRDGEEFYYGKDDKGNMIEFPGDAVTRVAINDFNRVNRDSITPEELESVKQQAAQVGHVDPKVFDDAIGHQKSAPVVKQVRQQLEAEGIIQPRAVEAAPTFQEGQEVFFGKDGRRAIYKGMSGKRALVELENGKELIMSPKTLRTAEQQQQATGQAQERQTEREQIARQTPEDFSSYVQTSFEAARSLPNTEAKKTIDKHAKIELIPEEAQTEQVKQALKEVRKSRKLDDKIAWLAYIADLINNGGVDPLQKNYTIQKHGSNDYYVVKEYSSVSHIELNEGPAVRRIDVAEIVADHPLVDEEAQGNNVQTVKKKEGQNNRYEVRTENGEVVGQIESSKVKGNAKKAADEATRKARRIGKYVRRKENGQQVEYEVTGVDVKEDGASSYVVRNTKTGTQKVIQDDFKNQSFYDRAANSPKQLEKPEPVISDAFKQQKGMTREEAQKLVQDEINRALGSLAGNVDIQFRKDATSQVSGHHSLNTDTRKNKIVIRLPEAVKEKEVLLTAFHEAGHYIKENYLSEQEKQDFLDLTKGLIENKKLVSENINKDDRLKGLSDLDFKYAFNKQAKSEQAANEMFSEVFAGLNMNNDSLVESMKKAFGPAYVDAVQVMSNKYIEQDNDHIMNEDAPSQIESMKVSETSEGVNMTLDETKLKAKVNNETIEGILSGHGGEKQNGIYPFISVRTKDGTFHNGISAGNVVEVDGKPFNASDYSQEATTDEVKPKSGESLRNKLSDKITEEPATQNEPKTKNEPEPTAEESAPDAQQFLGEDVTVTKGTHSKTEKDIWIMKPTEKLPKEKWSEMNKAVKDMGGRYYGAKSPENVRSSWVFNQEPNLSETAQETEEPQTEPVKKERQKEPAKKEPAKKQEKKPDKDAYANAKRKVEVKDKKGTWSMSGGYWESPNPHLKTNQYTFSSMLNDTPENMKNVEAFGHVTVSDNFTKKDLKERIKLANGYVPTPATVDKLYDYAKEIMQSWDQVRAYYKNADKKAAKKELDSLVDQAMERYKNDDRQQERGRSNSAIEEWLTSDEKSRMNQMEREYRQSYHLNEMVSSLYAAGQFFEARRKYDEQLRDEHKEDVNDEMDTLMDTDEDFQKLVAHVVNTMEDTNYSNYEVMFETAYRLYGYPKNREQHERAWEKFREEYLKDKPWEVFELSDFAKNFKEKDLPKLKTEHTRDPDELYYGDDAIYNDSFIRVKKVGTKYIHYGSNQQANVHDVDPFQKINLVENPKSINDYLTRIKQDFHNMKLIPYAARKNEAELAEWMLNTNNPNHFRGLLQKGLRKAEGNRKKAFQKLLDGIEMVELRQQFKWNNWSVRRNRDEKLDRLRELESELKQSHMPVQPPLDKGDVYVSNSGYIEEYDGEKHAYDDQYFIPFRKGENVPEDMQHIPENKRLMVALDLMLENKSIKKNVRDLLKEDKRKDAKDLIKETLVKNGMMDGRHFIWITPNDVKAEQIKYTYRDGKEQLNSIEGNLMEVAKDYADNVNNVEGYYNDAMKETAKDLHASYTDGDMNTMPKEKAEYITVRVLDSKVPEVMKKRQQAIDAKSIKSGESNFMYGIRTLALKNNERNQSFVDELMNTFDGTYRGQPAQETEVTTEPELKGGRTGKAVTERGTEIEYRYQLMDADDLVTSHNTSMNVDPKYPTELQPRDRARKSSLEQVTRISQKLDPELLGANRKASDGAPITNKKGVVESGNGRTIALKLAYERNMDTVEEYKNWLKENAGSFGFSKAAIDSVQHPVLVRVRTSDVDVQQFVKEANESGLAGMSSTEQAISDAKQLTDRHLALFEPAEDGSLTNAGNRDFVNAFVQDVIPQSERNRMYSQSGTLSQEGVNRIRNAVFQKAYDNADMLALMSESTDSNIKNIVNAMLKMAPRMVKIREGIDGNKLHPLHIGEDIAAAAVKYSELKQKGQDVKEFLNQQDAFANEFEDSLTDVQMDLLTLLNTDQYKRSAKQINELFSLYNDELEQLGSPEQLGFDFGEDTIPTKPELLEIALNLKERKDKEDEGFTLFTDQTIGSEESPSQKDSTRKGEKESEDEIRGFGGTTQQTEREEPPLIQYMKDLAADGGSDRIVSPKVARKVGHEIAQALNTVIRSGYVERRGAKGTFNYRKGTGNVKASDMTNLRVTAHELGHAYEHFAGGLQDLNNEELSRVARLLYPKGEKLKGKELLQEGLAEVFQLYIIDPDVAYEMAPKSAKQLDTFIAGNRLLNDTLLEVRQLIERDIEGNPFERVGGSVVTPKQDRITRDLGTAYRMDEVPADASPAEALKYKIKGGIKKLIASKVDFQIPFRDMQKALDEQDYAGPNIIKRMSVSGGSDMKATHAFESWATDNAGRYIIHYETKDQLPSFLQEQYDELNNLNPKSGSEKWGTKKRYRTFYKGHRKDGLSQTEAKEKAILDALSSRSLQEVATDAIYQIESSRKLRGSEFKDVLKELNGNKDMDGNTIFSYIVQSYRYRERYERGFKDNPISKKDAERVIDLSEKLFPGMENRVREYTNNLSEIILEKSYRNGLISQQSVKAIKEKSDFYIPTYKAVGKVKVDDGSSERKTSGQPIKKYQGSTEPVLDYLTASIYKLMEVEQAAEFKTVLDSVEKGLKQKGMGKFGELVKPSMLPQFISGSQIEQQLRKMIENTADIDTSDLEGSLSDQVFSIFVKPNMLENGKPIIMNWTFDKNGKRKPVYMRLEPDLYNSITSMKPVFASGGLMRALAKVSSISRYTALVTPRYMFNAMSRDTVTAFLQKDAERKFLRSTMRGMYLALGKNEQVVDQYMNSGAFASATENVLKSFKQKSITDGLVPTKHKNLWKIEKNHKLIRFMNPSNVLQWQEQVHRYGQWYRMAEEKALEEGFDFNKILDGRQKLTDEERQKMADILIDLGYEGSEVTVNFRGHGTDEGFRKASTAITFLHGSIQGLYREFREIEKHATNKNRKGITKYVTGRLTRRAITSLVPITVISWALTQAIGDEPDDIPSYLKDRYWLFPSPFGYLAVAKPFTYSIPTAYLERFMDDQYGGEGARTLLEEWGNPLKQNFGLPYMPIPMQVIRDLYYNKTWYGAEIVPYYEQKKPTMEQFDEETSPFAVMVAKKWYNLMNPNPKAMLENGEYDKFKFGKVSPYQIDYFIANMFGSYGRAGLEIFGGKETGKNESNPFASFTYTTDEMGSRAVSKFYDRLDNLEKLHELYGKKGEPNDTVKFARDTSDLLKSVRGMRKEIPDIPYTDEQKKDLKRQLSQAERDISRVGVGQQPKDEANLREVLSMINAFEKQKKGEQK